MANRQIDPDGPYMHGYQDGERGLPLRKLRLLCEARDYLNGYNAARMAERSPL